MQGDLGNDSLTDVLGALLKDEASLDDLASRGLPVTVAGAALRHSGLPLRSWRLRGRAGEGQQCLGRSEARQLLRVLSVWSHAMELHGDRSQVVAWMTAKVAWYGDRTPTTALDLARSVEGAQHLHRALAQTQHGIF